jgi:hypothetical protein
MPQPRLTTGYLPADRLECLSMAWKQIEPGQKARLRTPGIKNGTQEL